MTSRESHRAARLQRAPRRSGVAAFTLVEMMVSMSLLVIIAMVLFQTTNATSKINSRVSGETIAFEDAALAFQNVTQRISQAAINNYYDYYPSQRPDANGNPSSKPPQAYMRQSELHFIIGPAQELIPNGSERNNPTFAIFFQAPLGYSRTLTENNTSLGLASALNACGYYIDFGDDLFRPNIQALNAQKRFRYRLMEFIQPTEDLDVYRHANSDPTKLEPTEAREWFTDPLQDSNAQQTTTSDVAPLVRPIVDNVVAFILMPKASAGDSDVDSQAQDDVSIDYQYDSRTNASLTIGGNPVQVPQQHQLPPIVSVTMVVIDENLAKRAADATGSTAPIIWSPSNAPFTSVSEYPQDLNNLTDSLRQTYKKYHLPYNYRIFRADVPIRSAQWSAQ